MTNIYNKKTSIFNITSLLFGCLLFVSINSYSQTDSIPNKVVVHGIATNIDGLPLPSLMVINQNTKSGVFGSGSGKYSMEIDLDDKILFGAYGYNSEIVSFKDSLNSDTIVYNPVLEKLHIVLEEATIISPRELNKIHRDIETLGYEEKDYRVSGLNAATSPLTFLYQQFSKYEKQKRLAKELENEDRKRDLLKELLARYSYYEIVDLNDDEFDEFIDFLNVSDSFMKKSTQYEFIVYVKKKYIYYKEFHNPEKTMNLDDYDYDKD